MEHPPRFLRPFDATGSGGCPGQGAQAADSGHRGEARKGRTAGCQPHEGTGQYWSAKEASEPSGFVANVEPGDTRAADLAVLVSVTADVEATVGASLKELPRFRGQVAVSKPGEVRAKIARPGQAKDVMEVVLRGVDEARRQFKPQGKIHLFYAGPVSLAAMIVQSLNSFGPVQTYEHKKDESVVGRYERSVLLKPS